MPSTPTNTSGGTTVSFTNTPQAKDDWYSLTENDNNTTVIFDVMANDLGGNAKVLWSIDDSNLDGTYGATGTGDGTYDLIAKDVAGVCEKSDLGAKIWLTSDGKIGYDASVFNSLAAGQTAVDHFTYAIRLSNGTLSWATVTVTLTGTNDRPDIFVGTGDCAAATLAETNGGLSKNGTLTVIDPDTNNNVNVSVSGFAKSGNFGSLSDDVLKAMFTLGASTLAADAGSSKNLAWTFNSGTQAFNYLAVGQSLTLTYTITASDGSLSDSQTVTITVTGTNDGPVAVADTASATENQTITVDVLANDTDVDDGHVFTLVSAAAPSGQGSASVVGNQLQFNPGTDFDHLAQGATASVVVSYTMQDEYGAQSSSTLTITVTGTNDGPVAVADTASATENQTITVDVLANDTDVDDGHVFTLVSAAAPSGQGSASVVGNQLQFNPGTDFDHLAQGATASVVVSYTMQDEYGAQSSSTLTITVTGTNDGPVAVADTASATENQTITVDVLANDTDVDDGHVFTLVSAAAPSGQGSASVVGNQLQFNPGTDFDHLAQGATASVVVSYTMQDEYGAQSSSTLTITVTGTNDGPVAVADTASATENQTITVDVLANDTDVDDGHVFTLVSAAAPSGQGSASVVGNQLQFNPGTDFDHLAQGATASVVVSYTMQDEYGAQSSSTLTITVTGTNDGPVAVADTASATENQTITVDVLANDTDVDDGHVFTLVSAAAPSGQGSASVVGNQLQFNPGTDFDHLAQGATASVVVSYTMQDEYGAQSSSTLTITVTGTNDGPVAVADTASATENQTITVDVLANDTDVDDGHVFTLVSAAAPSGQGSASVVGNQLQFNPGTDFDHLAQGATASVVVSYTMQDEYGAQSSSTLTITVTGTNDGPVAVADTASATENQTITVDVLANDTDVDDGHVFTLVSAAAPSGQGSASVVGNQLQFNPGTDFDHLAQGATASVVVSYTMQDEYGAQSSSTLTITVTGTNDGPVAVADTASATENQTITVDVLANDTDVDDGHVFTLVSAAAPSGQGSASVVGNQLQFNPGTDFDHLAQGATASVVVSYTMQDEYGAQSSSTLTITVTGTNDGPVAVADTASATENQTITVDVLANDTDVDDGHVFTLVSAAAPSGQGSASVVGNQLQFNPGTDFDHLAQGATASVVVSYTMQDEYGAQSSSTLTITVTGTNDGPVAVADTASATENQTITVDVLANDTDVDDGHVFTLVSAAAPSGQGSASVVGNQLQFNPGTDFDHLAQGATASVVVSYTMQDEYGAQSSSTLTITVTGTNDGPVAVADTASATENQTITVDVLANDTDVDDGHVFTLVSAAAPSGQGSASVVGNQLQFNPGTDFDHLAQGATASVVVSYTMQDEYGAQSSSTLTITVTGTNDGPVAVADTASATENQTITVDVLANDTDVDDGHVFTLVSAAAPSGQGSASVVGNQLQFNPGTDFDHLAQGATASVVVSYTMQDEYGAQSSSTLTITVTGTNDGPVAVADTASATENQTITVDVLANDTDVDDGHVFTLVSAAAPSGQGSASVVGNQLQFNPGTDFDHLAQGATASVVVSYTMQDEYGAQSSSTLTITVTGTNDGPVAVADTASATENQTITVDVLANDTDVDDGHVFTLVSAAAPSGQGSASVVGNQLQFNPGTDFDHLAQGATASVVVSYTMQDEYGAQSSSTLTITVTGTNDGPVAVADTASATENQTITVDVLANDTDVDDGHVFTLVSAAAPSGQGSASVVGNQLQFNPGTDFDHLAQGATASVVVSYTMQDEYGAQSSSTLTITVTGTNDGPVAVADTASATENQTITVDVLANDTDVDDGHVFTLVSAAAPSGQGSASVVGNQLQFNPGTDFDHLAQGATASVVVSYTMQDEYGAQSSSTLTITVTGTNDGPVAVADTASATENQTITVDVLANDTDVDDGHVFTLVSAAAPSGQGSASVVGNQLQFNPGTDFDHLAQGATASVVVSYTMQDEYGAQSSSTLTITVTGTNDGPVAVADTASATENQTITVDVLANDTDVDDGHVFTLVSAAAPSGQGSASVVGNQLQFNPGTDFDHLAQGATASVVVSYTMQDEYGAQSSSTLTITVTGTNDGPVAVADTASATENQTITVDVLANDTDVDDGHVFTLVSAAAPSGQGSASVVGNQLQFNPGTDFDHLAQGATASVVVSYTMQDEYGAQSSSTLTITVTGTNDGPVAVADTASATENQTITVDVLANDTDVDDGHVFTLVSAAAPSGQGSASVVGNQLQFNPGTDFDHLAQGATASVVVSYTMQDEYGAQSSSTLTITVTGTNDGPVAVADTASATENQTITVDVLANDTDVDDGHVFTLVSAAAPSGQGSASVVGNQLQFNPGTDFDHLAQGATASVVVSYTMQDEYGAQSSSTLTITVTGTNDGPVAVADTASATENQTITVDVLANDTDVDDGHVFTLVSAAAPSGQGSASVVGNQLQFNPGTDFDHLAQGATASVVVSYTMQDEYGAQSSSTLTITVTGTNDGPVAVADTASATENQTITVDVLANDTDVDDGHVFTLVSAAAPSGQGSASVVGNQLQFNPGTDFDHLAQGATASVVVSYTMQDEYGAQSSSTLTITVTGTNDGPVAVADTASATENQTITVDVLANDTDVDDGHVFTLVSAAAPSGQGSASVVGNQLQFNPGTDFDHLAQGATASVVVSYTMQDEYGAQSSSTLTITVTGTNDGPVAVADTASATENQTITVDVLANDTDVDDGHVFTLVSAAAPSGQGSASVVGNQLQFNPGTDFDHLAQGATASVVVSYTMQDEYGAQSSSTLTITVTGTNDGPVAVADTASATENQTITVDVLANDTDVDDGHVFTLVSAAAPSGQGSASVVGNQLQFNPGTDFDHLAQGATASVVVSYTMQDEYGAQSSSTLTITVTGTNDAPTAPVDNNGAPNTVSANASNGTVVGVTANSTDPDTGNTITYSLSSNPGGLFAINASTGVVTVANSAGLNAGTYTIGVRATDNLGLAGPSSNFTITATSASPFTLTTSTTDKVVFASGTNQVFGTTNTLNGSDNLTGGSGADTLTVTDGGLGPFTFGTGNIIMTGFEVLKLVDTNNGNHTDTLTFLSSFSNGGTLTIDGTGIGGNGKLVLNGSATGNAFNVTGGNSDDTLSLGSGIDTVDGGNGNDRITGGGGADSLTGGTGNDTFVFISPSDTGNHIIDFNAGNSGTTIDKLEFSVGGSGQFAIGNNNLTVNFATGANGALNNSNTEVGIKTDAGVSGAASIQALLAGFTSVTTGAVFVVFNSDPTVNHAQVWYKPAGGGSAVLIADLDNITTLGGLANFNVGDFAFGTATAPAGISGEPINLGLASSPVDANSVVNVSIANLPVGWVITGATQQTDGTWLVPAATLSNVEVTTTSDFIGAAVLQVSLSWTAPDGTVRTHLVADNVEAFAPGMPIIAWSGDDTLTGSAGADTFVFSQPIGYDVVHNFDVSEDTIDLIAYAGFKDFADVQVALGVDAQGNALLTLADGQSITITDVAPEELTAANFQFDVTPTVDNSGIMTLGDGSMLPLSGTINNSGTISLDSHGATTTLQLVQYGITLQGGGNLTLSDNANNLVTGSVASVTFNNVDNVISGAGQLGGGSLIVTNGGTILANGVNALVIDTGSAAVTNSGTIQATSIGGLQVVGSIVNSGLIWANGGNISIGGDLSGAGEVRISGTASVEFGGDAANHVAIDAAATGTLLVDGASEFTGSISGLNSDDIIDLRGVAFGAATTMSFENNVLTVSDGSNSVGLHLDGTYQLADFDLISDGHGGTMLINHIGALAPDNLL